MEEGQQEKLHQSFLIIINHLIIIWIYPDYFFILREYEGKEGEEKGEINLFGY